MLNLLCRYSRWVHQLLCRHMDIDIDFEIDGKVPGWRWYCHTCGKRKELS